MNEREQLEQALQVLEAQRTLLGDAVVEAALGPMRRQLDEIRAKEAAPPLRGERKWVTVMFADLSGFTAMAETTDPELVRDLMNGCFERLVPIVNRYGGTVDKFIGDEVMALFGAPQAHENDPERALRAALDMKVELAAFNVERSTDLELHFGINTGPVIAGGLGTRERQEYTVMGDTVNVAARLEDVSQRGEILVGPDTYRLTAPLFEFETLVPVRVKGKADPVPVYRLLAAQAISGKVRGIAGLESPLVGRQAELRALQAAVERVQAGVGGIVTLVGEAGLGKSRLVAEVRRGAVSETRRGAVIAPSIAPSTTPPPTRRGAVIAPSLAPPTAPPHWIEGRCLSYGASMSYLLWLDLLRKQLGGPADAAPTAARDALLEQAQALCPHRMDDVFPYLARLMSLPLEPQAAAAMRELDGQELKARTFRAVETWLECTARRRPLVVVCEDLHWADPTSLELLEQLLPLIDRAPVLFLCVFRPERRHGCWRIIEVAGRDYAHRHITLALAPLSTAESGELVGHLLRVEGLPRPLRERILSHAEGNPFYVEEILRSLMDDGAIVHDEASGRWRAARDVADITLPDTLHGVLMARIDRLHQESKRVLQLASVIGRLFMHRVLAEIARHMPLAWGERSLREEQRLDDHLLTLQREEMIRERARIPELEYIFKHHLTQEAAYNGLLIKERRVFHRQVAETLERLFPERVEEQVGLLAYHWERAKDPEKATHYLLRAGDQARLAYAHAEAIDAYQRALALLKDQGKYESAAQTLMKLGLTHHTAFDFQQSRQAYQEGFALWKRAGETPTGASPAGEAPAGAPPPAPHAFRQLWRDPPTLDPTMADDSTSIDLIAQLFCGLVTLDAGENVVPDVARRWEVQDNGRRFVFTLRDDVYWSDGRPVTAGDFEAAWKRTLDPATGSPAASLLYDLKGARAFHRGEAMREDVGVRAHDDRTLIVELEGPTGYLLHLLTQSACYPIPRHVVEARGETWAEGAPLVSNGPFGLSSWQSGHSIVLARNPAYHGRARLRGNVERVELLLHDLDPATHRDMYEAGELDVLHLPPAEMDRARQVHADEYACFPALVTEYVGFNASRPPFDDPRVRRAFVLATDRETLAEVVMRGYVSPASGGFVPPAMPGHAAGIALPYDPEGARRLLAEAGYPGGRGFPEVHARARAASGPHLAHVQAQWREVLGVEIAWQAVEWARYLEELRVQPPHLFTMSWEADYPDPDNFLRVGLWWERVGWRNADYARLVERARRLTDQSERMALYGQAERILVQEAAIVPLFYGRRHRLTQPWISEPPPLAIGGPRWKDLMIQPHS